MQSERTPSRAWEHPTAPRETNADERLKKVHMVTEMRKKLKELEQEMETGDVAPRPAKRIKVTDAAEIPHRAPGDSLSTFRVPDVDSDDEMEVDEEVEMKTNVFEASQVEEVQKEMEESPWGKGKQSVRDTVQEVAHERTPGTNQAWAFPKVGETARKAVQTVQIAPTAPKVKDVWAFPSVGTQSESVVDPLLGKKFDLGLEGWKRGQQLVEW